MGNDQSRGGGGSGSGTPQQSSPGAPPPANSLRASLLAPRPPRDPLYHMKLVVRGKRGVGKSSLLARLQGQPFSEAVQPSPEIATASIAWQYKNMDDKIEVEVWDVVDTVLRDDDAPAGQWECLVKMEHVHESRTL